MELVRRLFIVSSLAAIGTVIVASMAAFALSRMRFRYKNIVLLGRSWPAS